MFKEIPSKLQLLLFAVATSVIAYGFNLTNFSLSIDSEPVVLPDSYMALGRWGTNLIRYHLFGGIIVPYFTILLSLILLSCSAVLISGLFGFNRVQSHVFCALFLTFPQMAYQLIFYIQADAVALGFLLSAVAVMLFLKFHNGANKVLSAVWFILAALVIMFVISIYQALIFVPAIIYLIIIFRNTYNDDYTFGKEFKKTLLFGLLLLVSIVFYYISEKILCPQAFNGGYMASYTDVESGNRFVNFYNSWIDNMRGDMYYGDKMFVFATLCALGILILLFLKERKMLLVRGILIFLMLFVPFLISVFITSGGTPPRLYVASGIVFAFIIVHFTSGIKFQQFAMGAIAVVVLTNIYFITRLYVSQHAIYNYDMQLARRINARIMQVYPEFEPRRDYVYFYGAVGNTELNSMRLPDSEIFAASFFQWDKGSNGRIIPFIKSVGVADYKVLENKESLNKAKNVISDMPLWPAPGSVTHVDDVVVIKLGNIKGAPLAIE